MALVIEKADWEALRRHGEETYPYESCGVLVGIMGDDGTKSVHAVIPCRNNREDSPNNRYEISPVDLFRIQRDCRNTGHEIIGFYHSHPDHPAQWSSTDLAEAHWTGCSYVITRVEGGQATQTQSFKLLGDSANPATKRFEDEEIQIL